MNLSVFDNDTLGLVDGRSVVLRGTTTVNRLFNSSVFPIESWLETALENAGFDVVNARYEWNSWFNDNSINVEIELNVYNWHTSDEARQNAIAAIEAYTANDGLNKVFFNTTLTVSYDGYVAPGTSPTGNTGGGGSRGGGPPSGFDSSGNQRTDRNDDDDDDDGNSFLKGLGLSTPWAILGAAVIALVVLRK